MKISAATFESEVLESELPTLVDFWASWCLPCKLSEDLVDRIKKKYKGKLKVCKINVDQNPVIQEKYSIKGLPTFITFKNHGEVERKVGALTESQFDDMISNIL